MTVAIFRPSLASRLLRAVQAMFAASEKGVWYDPSDMQSLYQDSAGTTPVTAVTQPVGLMLDKSQGLTLGPELVTNGTFDTDTGWVKTGGTYISEGAANFSGNYSAYDWLIRQTIFGLIVGKTYLVTATFIGDLTTAVSLQWFGVGITPPTTVGGVFTCVYTATSTSAEVGVVARYTTGTRTGSLDNISVKLLDGYHAAQSTSTARPLLGREPMGGRRNLLTYTEDFGNAAWGKTAATATTDKISETAVTSAHIAGQSFSATSTAISIELKAAERGFALVGDTAHAVSVNLTTGVASLATGSPTNITCVATSDGYFRVGFTATYAGNGNLYIYTSLDGIWANRSYLGVTGSGIYARKAQLELGSTPTANQKVVSDLDVTEAGVNDSYRAVLDKVDDLVTLTVPTGGFIGTMVLSTPQGTAAYGVNIPAGAHNIGGIYFPGTAIVGAIIRNGALTDAEITAAGAYYVSKGGGPAGDGAYAGVTSFASYWRGMNRLTSMPMVNSSAVTNMQYTWMSCSGLTGFPQINTSLVVYFRSAWEACSSLTSFPLLNTSAATNLAYAWLNCTSLANFPANMFDACPATDFLGAFLNCALTQTSVDNILISINTANTSTGTLNMTGGTSATPSAAGIAAKDALVARGWTVTTNP